MPVISAELRGFALVVTDQTMPGMTGLDLATQLRQVQPGLPVILMTGYGPSLTSERLKAAGGRELLIKPVSARVLGVAVRSAISLQPNP